MKPYSHAYAGNTYSLVHHGQSPGRACAERCDLFEEGIRGKWAHVTLRKNTQMNAGG